MVDIKKRRKRRRGMINNRRRRKVRMNNIHKEKECVMVKVKRRVESKIVKD